MDRDGLTELIVSEISEIIGVEKDKISADASIRNDLDVTSLEIMVLLGNLEAKTGVTIESGDISGIDTVSQLVDTVMEKKENEEHQRTLS